MTFRERSGRRQIVVPDGLANAEDSAPDRDEALVIAISRAHRWKKMLDEGKYGSIRQMASSLGVAAPYMSKTMRLTLLAPDIIEAIVDGREPEDCRAICSANRCRRCGRIRWLTLTLR